MEPVLLSSECDVYQHYTFIVVVVVIIILLNFMEQTFMPDLGWVLLNPRSHLNFTKLCGWHYSHSPMFYSILF